MANRNISHTTPKQAALPPQAPSAPPVDGEAAAETSTVLSKGQRGVRRPRQRSLFGSYDALPGWDPADSSGGSYGSKGFGATGHGSRGDVPGASQGGWSPDAPRRRRDD